MVSSLQVSNWRVLMKLGTSFVFTWLYLTFCNRRRKNGSMRRGPYFNKTSARVQRLWSKETDERISD